MLDRDLENLLERTVAGLGYEMVDVETAGGRSGVLLRLFIDREGGISVDDCAAVSNHLTRVLAVEGIDYGRLEVSSPGLDRPLKHPKDFRRFEGERAQLRMRVPIQGRRNFVGVLRGADEHEVRLEVDGALLTLELAQLAKARLVPNI
jgi:ribosome maturation factor RimP